MEELGAALRKALLDGIVTGRRMLRGLIGSVDAAARRMKFPGTSGSRSWVEQSWAGAHGASARRNSSSRGAARGHQPLRGGSAPRAGAYPRRPRSGPRTILLAHPRSLPTSSGGRAGEGLVPRFYERAIQSLDGSDKRCRLAVPGKAQCSSYPGVDFASTPCVSDRRGQERRRLHYPIFCRLQIHVVHTRSTASLFTKSFLSPSAKTSPTQS